MELLNSSFWKIKQPGIHEDFPNNWEFTAESNFMRQHKLVYKKDGTDLDKKKVVLPKWGIGLCKMLIKSYFIKEVKRVIMVEYYCPMLLEFVV